MTTILHLNLIAAIFFCFTSVHADEHVGVGAKPIQGSEVIFDGTRKMLDSKWTYWKGGFASKGKSNGKGKSKNWNVWKRDS